MVGRRSAALLVVGRAPAPGARAEAAAILLAEGAVAATARSAAAIAAGSAVAVHGAVTFAVAGTEPAGTEAAGTRAFAQLLGLFVGTSLLDRSVTDIGDLPNTMYLFQNNLERMVTSREDLEEEIDKNTDSITQALNEDVKPPRHCMEEMIRA